MRGRSVLSTENAQNFQMRTLGILTRERSVLSDENAQNSLRPVSRATPEAVINNTSFDQNLLHFNDRLESS